MSHSRPRASSIVGKLYLERGERVTVVAAWGGGTTWAEQVAANGTAYAFNLTWHGRRPARGPRNVLIHRHATGELVIRPFRGLRNIPIVDRRPTPPAAVRAHDDASARADGDDDSGRG